MESFQGGGMMFSLTHPASSAIIQTVASNGDTGLASRITAVQTALTRFFCAQNFSVLHFYVGLGGTVARLAGAVPVRQFHPVRLHDWRHVVRVYNLSRTAVMNTISLVGKSAQNPQTKSVSVFSIFLHRRLLAANVAGAKAMRIKRRNPACIVKFVGFAGGVL